MNATRRGLFSIYGYAEVGQFQNIVAERYLLWMHFMRRLMGHW